MSFTEPEVPAGQAGYLSAYLNANRLVLDVPHYVGRRECCLVKVREDERCNLLVGIRLGKAFPNHRKYPGKILAWLTEEGRRNPETKGTWVRRLELRLDRAHEHLFLPGAQRKLRDTKPFSVGPAQLKDIHEASDGKGYVLWVRIPRATLGLKPIQSTIDRIVDRYAR